jgi:hypothetical protein
MERIISDEEINILLKINPEGRYELKEIAKILKMPYATVNNHYNNALKKLKKNPEKWNRFMTVLKRYLVIKRRKRESQGNCKKK